MGVDTKMSLQKIESDLRGVATNGKLKRLRTYNRTYELRTAEYGNAAPRCCLLFETSGNAQGLLDAQNELQDTIRSVN